MKDIIKNGLAVLLTVFFVNNICSMRISERGREFLGKKAVLLKSLNGFSLEKLVALLDNKLDLSIVGGQEVVLERIDKILHKTLWAILSQYEIDHGKPLSYSEISHRSYSPLQNVGLDLFRNYKGAMMPVRSGFIVLHIPDYRVLKNQQSNEKMKFIPREWFGVWEKLRAIMPDTIDDLDRKTHRSGTTRVDFLDYLLQGLQETYNALPWRRRWLQLPW